MLNVGNVLLEHDKNLSVKSSEEPVLVMLDLNTRARWRFGFSIIDERGSGVNVRSRSLRMYIRVLVQVDVVTKMFT